MPIPFLRHVFPSSHYVLLSLLFFAGLEVTFALQRWLVPLLAILLGLLAIGIMLVRIEERGQFRLMQAILPVLAVAGLIGFGLFLTQQYLHLYFIMASLILYWLLRNGAKMAYPTWNWTLATLIFFFDMAPILGLRFHLYIPIIIVLAVVFVVAFLISLQALVRISPLFSDAILISLAMSLVLTQLAWTLQFLPVHYIVQAGVLVAFYYVFFHLISVSYERQLNTRDITEYGAVATFALVLILLNARWK